MNIPLNELPDSARLWIFQSSRPLTTDEQHLLLQMAGRFISQWTAHQHQLKAGCEMVDGLFLLVAVDEQQAGASGCSLDKLHHFVRDAGRQFSLDLLDRLNVAVQQDASKSWRQVRLSELESMLSSGEMGGDVRVADVSVQTLGDFRAGFVKPLRATWLNRYISA